MEGNVIGLKEMYCSIKKRWKIIFIITLLTTIISLIFSFFVIKPKYEARTKLFIGKQETSDNNLYDSSDVVMYQQLMKTYAELVKTSDLVEKAIKNTSFSNVQVGNILNNLTATPSADTQILDLSFKGNNPKEVLEIINLITEEFITESKQLIPNGNVQVIQKAQFPSSPVSPNKIKNTILSLILGLMIGITVVLLLEYLDNTFKSREELEKTLDLPVIGTIPNYDSI